MIKECDIQKQRVTWTFGPESLHPTERAATAVGAAVVAAALDLGSTPNSKTSKCFSGLKARGF